MADAEPVPKQPGQSPRHEQEQVSGSLCSGYGGLDLAVDSHYGTRLAWVSEVDRHAAKVLDARFAVPNLGDLTEVEWSTVEPVDVLTAGYPCQPFSHAGCRKGATDDRHIWPHIANAVRVLRPRRVVLENVAGHLSLGLDVVLGDLATLGFDARWGCVRASDAGAPHRRERIFIVATDTRRERRPQDPRGAHRGEGRRDRTVKDHVARRARPEQPVTEAASDTDGVAGEPGRPQQGRPGTVDEPGTIERAQRLRRVDWGDYEPAIRRWEHVTGCPAPAPADDRGRLAPPFVEWMMGLPAGWVTELVPQQTHALRILGNGVVWQQAALALSLLASAADQPGEADRG